MPKKRKYNNRSKTGRFGAGETPSTFAFSGLPDPAATPQTHDPQRHHENEESTAPMPHTDVEVDDDGPHFAWEDPEADCWTDEEMSDDSDWEEERHQKRQKLTNKGVEAWMAGPANKTGVTRGHYSTNGSTERSIQRKKKEVKKALTAGHLTDQQYNRKLGELNRISDAHQVLKRNQSNLHTFFLTKRPPSHAAGDLAVQQPEETVEVIDDNHDDINISQESSTAIEGTHAEVFECELEAAGVSDSREEMAVAGDPLLEEEWESDSEHEDNEDEQARAPTIPEIVKLVTDALKKERKGSNHQNIRVLASLKDFYNRVEELGRMESAREVSRSVGKGPSFARCTTFIYL